MKMPYTASMTVAVAAGLAACMPHASRFSPSAVDGEATAPGHAAAHSQSAGYDQATGRDETASNDHGAANGPTAPSGPTEGPTLFIALTGDAEGVGLGDPDGSGTAELLIDAVHGRLCYVLTVENIAPARLAHIHRSPVGEAGGPIVVQLEAPTDGESERCVAVSPTLAESILRSPADYYVNVHNADYPGGAVRGQLGPGAS